MFVNICQYNIFFVILFSLFALLYYFFFLFFGWKCNILNMCITQIVYKIEVKRTRILKLFYIMTWHGFLHENPRNLLERLFKWPGKPSCEYILLKRYSENKIKLKFEYNNEKWWRTWSAILKRKTGISSLFPYFFFLIFFFSFITTFTIASLCPLFTIYFSLFFFCTDIFKH